MQIKATIGTLVSHSGWLRARLEWRLDRDIRHARVLPLQGLLKECQGRKELTVITTYKSAIPAVRTQGRTSVSIQNDTAVATETIQ